MAQHIFTGIGAPSFAPTKLGQHYIETSTGTSYISTGTSSTADWKPSTALSNEQIQDAVGPMFAGTYPITATYNDALNTVQITLTEAGLNHNNLMNVGTNSHFTIDNHIGSLTNPHNVTKLQVGLGNCDNTSDANKPISNATQTALNAKENTIFAGGTSQYWRGDKTWQELNKSAVGLGNVDNTSDASKPISTLTQTALNLKYDANNPNNYETPAQLNTRDTNNRNRINHTGTQTASTISDFTTSVDFRITNQKGQANGIATLDATVKIPVGQIPALPYAPTSHTHTASQITDFSSAVTTITNPLYATVGHTHADATTVASGFMSAADKVKLDGITNDVFYKTTAALTNSSNSTLTSITELGIPVVAGNAYRFRFWILYRSTATTTGLVVAMTATAGATGTLSANLRNNTSTTTAVMSTLNAFNTVLTYTSTPTANTDFIAEIEGIFVCTASGNIVPQFRSETNGQTITVRVNSIAEVKQL